MHPAAHSLALLRSCRQVFEETNYLWLGRLRFNFECVESLLDKLSAIPASTLSQIRHLRARDRTLIMSHLEAEEVLHGLPWALKLLPSLRLDTLTVLGSPYPYDLRNYTTVNDFIEHGNGWKGLHYISPDPTMLGFKKTGMNGDTHEWRRPQPSTCKKMLLSRDGTDSQVTVTILQAPEAIGTGAVSDKNCRPPDQSLGPLETLETLGLQ
jgi:hypothetical protein